MDRPPILVDYRLLKTKGSPMAYVSNGIKKIIPTSEFLSRVELIPQESLWDKLTYGYNRMGYYYFKVVNSQLFWNLVGISMLVGMIFFFYKISKDFPENPNYLYYDNYREDPPDTIIPSNYFP